MSELTVLIDDRARLVTAVLAAGDWPAREQTQAPHAVHRQSKLLRQFVDPFQSHPAVLDLNERLAGGTAVSDFFTTALRCSWPELIPQETLPAGFQDGRWVKALIDFADLTSLAAFWSDQAAAWEQAYSGLRAIFERSLIIPFLETLTNGRPSQRIAVMPTITYPMLAPVLADTSAALFFILPPAKAWGESPPWPHGEDPAWAVAQTCHALARHFLQPDLAQLDARERSTLLHAAVTLCLETEFDQAEAMAYLVRKKKGDGLPQLPLIVNRLREFLAAANGRPLSDLFI